MVDIDYSQFKILGRIRRHKSIKHDDLSDEEINICEFLFNHGFVTKNKTFNQIPNKFDNVPVLTVDSYKITEKGKAQLSAYVAAFHKWWLPLIVSIASLILSCISLLKQ